MKTGEDTKKRILEASETLFCHYGFSKTTMAEIAKKCDMSAANIYRFFEGKEEILAEMAGRHFSHVEAALEEVVRQPGMDSVARLEAFVLTILNQAHTLTCCNEKMSEVVGFIQQRRADMVDRHWERMRSLLAEIIGEGCRRGEFQAADAVDSADVVLKATSFFQAPQCLTQLSLADLEASARKVVRLLADGLKKR